MIACSRHVAFAIDKYSRFCRFWDAVQELKCVHSRDVAHKVQEIWNEYLGPG